MKTVFKTSDDVRFAVKIAESMNSFIALRKKPFAVIPNCLLQSINQELTGSARAIYFYIYAQAEQNFNSSGNTCPVIVSAKTLAEYHIFKSERTIKRRLAELKAKGYIFMRSRFNDKSGLQQSNAVWLSIPESLQPNISATPNRRTIIQNEQEHASQEASIASGEQLAVHEHYTQLVAELMATGVNIAKANMRAYNMLSQEER